MLFKNKFSDSQNENTVNANISDTELLRRKYRKNQNRKSILISLFSFLILLIIIVIVLSNSKGWHIVQDTFFNGKMFLRSLPEVFFGILTNLKILIFAALGTAVLATCVAFLRTTTAPVLFPLRFIAAAYTDIFRSIPMIIVLYLIGFGIPALNYGIRFNMEILGTCGVILVYSAYVAEVLRAGIGAVHPSQRMAARSLGLSHGKTMRIVIIPQAIRKVVPALMNDFVAMQKDVGMISILGIYDAVRNAQILAIKTFNYTPYIVAALLFICLGFPCIRLTDWYTKKLKEKEEMAGAV